MIDFVKKSKNLSKKNLHKQITSKCNANKVALKQNFKNVTVLSIQKSGIKLKIEKATVLIRVTEFRVYEIAEEIGYKKATHFTTAFKKNTGMLPKAYQSLVHS